jgi:Ni,Fe-hydrogenase I cytochrome b subunit
MARAELTSARIYDPVLRLLHGVNALLVFLLLISGLVTLFSEPGALSARLHVWHGWLGAALVVGLLGRLAWGLSGPMHARLAEMWQPRAWREAAASRHFFQNPVAYGHHPVASLAYLAAYGLMAGLALSGLMLLAIKEGLGPFKGWLAWHAAWLDPLAPLHEIGAWTMLGFVCLHFAALILHPLLHHVPVAQSMLSGIQYLPKQGQR